MSIPKEFFEIRELFNNARKEQRISFLEVLGDLSKGVIDITKKPLETPETVYLKPILDNVTASIVEDLKNAEPGMLERFIELFPVSPPGKMVSTIGIRKDRVRISENLREYYKTIGTKEENDIVMNRKIFLGLLEKYGFIEKQNIEGCKFYSLLLQYAEQIYNIDEKGEMKLKEIEDIKDPGFKEIYHIACDLLGEDFIKEGFKEGIDIEAANYYLDRETIGELYNFLEGWNGITDYSSHFNEDTGEISYKGKSVVFGIDANPFRVLQYLYSGDISEGIDMEDTYNEMQRKSRWNRKHDYDRGGSIQLENVIKGINKAFKKNFSNQKLIRYSGGRAYLIV